ncbi:hypothetical protein M972_112799 [Acetivibrio thermocellus AD2]|jgi:hypothetical protein|uniref:Bacterial repeat domain-containing protein n=1 Tax=Acetivibrio thermocellus AD2 TaxID=1138384 RepID=A0AB36TKC9_ACETH|nr:hypothetical protein [Acetivibrio thermocellus]ADU75676.1 hypothetical protein Clo1313_2687 [Acetivibrio thermocellus DSM 1313]ALX09697.1 hypothetical protein AD2_02717 [Acetivibrio thermocellus AD2]ANV77470.1 hypothetical protein LQRI_2729 [Acetivibrio thermocellus DSM 2360]EIC03595.1 hypothetical protein YSBL_2746 [Acetivibrio thermocellus YS]PFH03980.1 hypothetical protein M972_112799 [Acetivibrio thermocellus AD2]
MKGKIKQFISLLVTVVLMAGMFPISMMFASDAVFEPVFTVIIDESVIGDISVTLTNFQNKEETRTEPVINGVATFENFVNLANSYDIKITGMFGYKDYYRSNIYFSGPSISFSASDFVPAEVIKVSGKIYDENGNLYKGGGTVSYSVYNGYNSYTVNFGHDGSFSVEIYKNTPYNFTFTTYELKYDSVSLGPISSDKDIDNLEIRFSLRTFSITTNASGNGTISPSEHSVPYGSDYTICAKADSGYEIEEFIVDGEPKWDAVGKDEYTYSFYHITGNHTVSVTFTAKTYELEFWFNSDGKIVDGSFKNINNGGKISVKSGESPSFTAIANPNYHISQVLIDGVEQKDGTFDNEQTTYTYTFNNISSNHHIQVTFSINRYTINISTVGKGRVYAEGAPYGPKVDVEHGQSVKLLLIPDWDYDVKEVLLDGVEVNNYNLSGNGISYIYELPSITSDHDITVTFGEMGTVEGDESDFYTIVTKSLLDGYPIVSDGVRIYNFKNKDASLTFKLNNKYSSICINGTVYFSQATITESTFIEEIKVYRHLAGWKKIKMPEKIQIIIDKKAPLISDIPPMEWTNQDYTVEAKVFDEDAKDFPSSGLSRVVWSKKPLTKEEVLAEETNIIPIADGTFSYTITTEQNNEKFYFYAIDNADNMSEPKTIDVKIDKTKPEITEFTFRKKQGSASSQVINFLTFGTFSSDEIEVVVTAQDPGISSGLKEITLYSDGVAVETKTVTENFAVFNLTLENFSGNEISASVKDVAGNDSARDGLTKPTDVKTNAFSNFVGLRNEKPTVVITPMNRSVYREGEKEWHNDSVAFSVYAATDSAGIYSVEIKVNGKTVATDKTGKAVNADFFESQTLKETFTVDTDFNAMDGENNIEAIVTNNYGNMETARVKVFIDKTNPRIIGFNITAENNGILSKILNFLSFGNFFNERVRVTVIADDRYGATSGINTIILYMNGNPVNGSPKTATLLSDGTYKAEFVLPERLLSNDVSLNAVLSAVAVDNVGNITGKDKEHPNGVPVTPDKVNSDFKSSKLIIETVNPAVSIFCPEPDFTANDGKKWYLDDVVFKVSVKDLDAGIRSVRIKINGTDITKDIEGKIIDAEFYNKETHEEVFLVSTGQAVRADDGSYLIEVTAVDNAGNSYFLSDVVYKDTDIPVVTDFSFVPSASDGVKSTSQFIDFLEYGFYFKTEFNVVVSVSDNKPSSGLDKINYRLVSYDNGKKSEEKKGTQIIADGTAVISVPKGFKGQIFVAAFDNAGNKSREVTPGGFVSDDVAPEISITNNTTTNYSDAEGNKLYVTDMSFTVTISDYDSGIKEIGFSLSSEKESFERKSTLIANKGYKVGDVLENGWIVSEMDQNLVRKVTKVFTFSSDNNDIFLTFDASDRSGNKKENIRTEKVTIDKTAPVINVEFRPDENKNNYYYSGNRAAQITVVERNFDAGLIKTSIENKIGRVPTVSFSQKSNTEHVAVIEFDEGDYVFDISGTDLGNHTAVVNFSGENEKLFYVDKTKPSIEENFATFTNEATNNSFNTDKTAVIKITEHNFDPQLAGLKVFRKDPGEEHNEEGFVDITSEILSTSRWVSEGDVHTISFTFSRDAVYKIEINPEDLAGNSAEPRRTVVFEIDKTPPVVKARNGVLADENDTAFVDVYPYSRKDDPAPTVEFSDLNIDHIRYNLTVYIPDHTSKEAETVIKPVRVYLDEDTDKSGRIKGSIFTLPDFTRDGVYALELTAVDVAGNESLLNLNTYARMVEQDVLAYIMDSNPEAKTGLYSFQYENGEPISKRPDNFSDIKICAFAKDDTDVEVVLRDNNGDEIKTDATGTIDDSIYGFNIHNLVLESRFFKETFQDDTDIELHLSVKNDGRRVDLGTMHIDNIAPTCELPEEFRSWHWYFGEEERTITVSNINELVDENRCKVYDNGREIDFKYYSDNNTLTFTLGKGWHNVGIVLVDMAGNVNNIQEIRNIHVGFFWLWVIAAGSAVLIAAIVAAVIHNIRKRRKEEEENELAA